MNNGSSLEKYNIKEVFKFLLGNEESKKYSLLIRFFVSLITNEYWEKISGSKVQEFIEIIKKADSDLGNEDFLNFFGIKDEQLSNVSEDVYDVREKFNGIEEINKILEVFGFFEYVFYDPILLNFLESEIIFKERNYDWETLRGRFIYPENKEEGPYVVRDPTKCGFFDFHLLRDFLDQNQKNEIWDKDNEVRDVLYGRDRSKIKDNYYGFLADLFEKLELRQQLKRRFKEDHKKDENFVSIERLWRMMPPQKEGDENLLEQRKIIKEKGKELKRRFKEDHKKSEDFNFEEKETDSIDNVIDGFVDSYICLLRNSELELNFKELETYFTSLPGDVKVKEKIEIVKKKTAEEFSEKKGKGFDFLSSQKTEDIFSEIDKLDQKNVRSEASKSDITAKIFFRVFEDFREIIEGKVFSTANSFCGYNFFGSKLNKQLEEAFFGILSTEFGEIIEEQLGLERKLRDGTESGYFEPFLLYKSKNAKEDDVKETNKRLWVRAVRTYEKKKTLDTLICLITETYFKEKNINRKEVDLGQIKNSFLSFLFSKDEGLRDFYSAFKNGLEEYLSDSAFFLSSYMKEGKLKKWLDNGYLLKAFEGKSFSTFLSNQEKGEEIEKELLDFHWIVVSDFLKSDNICDSRSFSLYLKYSLFQKFPPRVTAQIIKEEIESKPFFDDDSTDVDHTSLGNDINVFVFNEKIFEKQVEELLKKEGVICSLNLSCDIATDGVYQQLSDNFNPTDCKKREVRSLYARPLVIDKNYNVILNFPRFNSLFRDKDSFFRLAMKFGFSFFPDGVYRQFDKFSNLEWKKEIEEATPYGPFPPLGKIRKNFWAVEGHLVNLARYFNITSSPVNSEYIGTYVDKIGGLFDQFNSKEGLNLCCVHRHQLFLQDDGAILKENFGISSLRTTDEYFGLRRWTQEIEKRESLFNDYQNNKSLFIKFLRDYSEKNVVGSKKIIELIESVEKQELSFRERKCLVESYSSNISLEELLKVLYLKRIVVDPLFKELEELLKEYYSEYKKKEDEEKETFNITRNFDAKWRKKWITKESVLKYFLFDYYLEYQDVLTQQKRVTPVPPILKMYESLSNPNVLSRLVSEWNYKEDCFWKKSPTEDYTEQEKNDKEKNLEELKELKILQNIYYISCISIGFSDGKDFILDSVLGDFNYVFDRKWNKNNFISSTDPDSNPVNKGYRFNLSVTQECLRRRINVIKLLSNNQKTFEEDHFFSVYDEIGGRAWSWTEEVSPFFHTLEPNVYRSEGFAGIFEDEEIVLGKSGRCFYPEDFSLCNDEPIFQVVSEEKLKEDISKKKLRKSVLFPIRVSSSGIRDTERQIEWFESFIFNIIEGLNLEYDQYFDEDYCVVLKTNVKIEDALILLNEKEMKRLLHIKMIGSNIKNYIMPKDFLSSEELKSNLNFIDIIYEDKENEKENVYEFKALSNEILLKMWDWVKDTTREEIKNIKHLILNFVMKYRFQETKKTLSDVVFDKEKFRSVINTWEYNEDDFSRVEYIPNKEQEQKSNIDEFLVLDGQVLDNNVEDIITTITADDSIIEESDGSFSVIGNSLKGSGGISIVSSISIGTKFGETIPSETEPEIVEVKAKVDEEETEQEKEKPKEEVTDEELEEGETENKSGQQTDSKSKQSSSKTSNSTTSPSSGKNCSSFAFRLLIGGTIIVVALVLLGVLAKFLCPRKRWR